MRYLALYFFCTKCLRQVDIRVLEEVGRIPRDWIPCPICGVVGTIWKSDGLLPEGKVYVVDEREI
jgi:hypothetical protein